MNLVVVINLEIINGKGLQKCCVLYIFHLKPINGTFLGKEVDIAFGSYSARFHRPLIHLHGLLIDRIRYQTDAVQG